MSSDRQNTNIAFVATLVFHLVVFIGLQLSARFIDRSPATAEPVEIEIIEPPRPPPVKKVEPPPPPPPEPEPTPEPQPEPPKPKIRPKRVVDNPPPRRATSPPPVSEPAPGPNTNNDVPAPVVQMPDLAIGGSGPPVAVGRPKTRKVGPGGTGTNTGGGGKPDSTGTGGPRPVSIASIKTKAKPLNPNLDAGKLYPDAAKRAEVEGKLKVKLVVDEKGRVVSRSLVTKLGHGLDELALKLAKKLRFEPARDTNDRPVRSVVVWTFTFVLPR